MHEFACKDLGFECDFVIKDAYLKALIGFNDHTLEFHGMIFQESFLKKIMQNHNAKRIKNDLVSCDEDSCRINLEKWKIGHRNFP